jgi:Ca2+-binding EF-hand superfamily protein
VNRPGTVSPFLKNTHRDLKQQIAVLQGHIKFIQDLAVMKDHKKVDLLFQMIDRDGGGTVDAEELATAMRQNDELSFSDSIEKAIDMVATFDINGDGELDRAEFLNYVTAMVQELGVSISDFSEFLVVQLLLSQETPEEKLAGELAREHINEEVKKREELFAALSNDQMTELFEMFDKGSSGEIPFQKVAKSLYQCTRNEGKAVHEALAVLLMIDMNDTRMLDYEQFGRLILAVSKTTGKSLEDTSDDLMNALDSQSAWDANAGFELMVSNDGTSVFDGGSVRDGNNEPIDALTYGRLKKLFKLWDTDGDGDISVTELADGLRKFQNASGIKVDADALAQALISFDEDGDNQLDPREFAKAMILYAQQFGVELHSLIDFMCSSSSTGSNSKAFKEEPPTFGKPAFEVDFWD